MIAVTIEGMSQVVLQIWVKLLTPLQLIAHNELFNLTGTVGKVELISTFTTAVFKSWNVSDKYTWDNAGDLKQLSIDQTLSENNRSD